MSKEKKELLTPQEVAKYLKISKELLAKWRSNGDFDLPYFKVGRAVRYWRDDVEKWLKDGRGKSR